MKKTSPVLVAFVTVAIDLLGFGIVLPLLPIYAEHFLKDVPPAYHGAAIGLLMSSFSLMQFLFAPGWGRLSDRIGRRPVLMIGLGGSCAFYALFGLATWQQSLTLLFVSRIGAGIAAATIGTAQAVIADCSPPEKRARGMALIGMAFGIGFTVGPLIGAFFASDDPTHPTSVLPGFVASALSLLALLLAVFRLPETWPAVQVRRRPWIDLEGWSLALGNRSTAIPLLTFFVATLGFASFEGILARFTKDELQYTLRQMGYLFAFIGVVLALTQGLFVRRMVTRMGEIPLCVIGIVMMMAGLLAVAMLMTSSNMGLILVGLAMTVSGFACLTPTAQALISRRRSALRQGEVLGVNQAAAAIARILGPLMGNMLYGSRQALHHGLPLYAGAALLGLALLTATQLGVEPATATVNE